MQPAECRPRLDTEFVGENAAQLVERRECRLLAARGVERPQPQLPQRLEVGVLGDQRHQVRDGTVGRPVVSRAARRCWATTTRTSASRLRTGSSHPVSGRRHMAAGPAAEGVVGDPQRVGRVRGGVAVAAAAVSTCESTVSGGTANR